MATTKRRSTTTRRSTGGSSRASTRRSSDMPETLMRSAERNPKTAAAIAAGLLTGIAAGIAGYFAFKRSGKSWEDFSGDIATSVKDSAASAGARIKDGLDDVKTRAQDMVDRRKDGLDEEDKTQAMFAEEAMTLKETGKKTKRPVDETIDAELKTGSIAY